MVKISHLKEEKMGSLNPWWRETWVHHITQKSFNAVDTSIFIESHKM
jgi:hypothetical protein